MRPVTPRGFRDVLPVEAAQRECVLDSIREVFSAWGYEPVETPVVEVYESLEAASSGLEDAAFRLFDLDGKLLSLRPDMTVPIARLVASRLDMSKAPFRFRYAGEVFREHESLRGQARQFTQTGVELVGLPGPAADAEIVAMLGEAIASTGLEGFTIAIGDVEVLSAVVGMAGGDDTWRSAVLGAAHDNNLVEIDRLAAQPGVSEQAGDAIKAVVRIRGGADAIESCREVLAGLGLADVLDGLAETWRLLEAAGASERVIVDFGVMRAFDYYTGLVFEAYAPGIGLPVGGGGRYDGVLGRYSVPAPAVGFALGLERLMIALAESAGMPAHKPVDAVIGGDDAAAFSEAAARRGRGQRVVLAPGLTGADLSDAAQACGAEAVEAR